MGCPARVIAPMEPERPVVHEVQFPDHRGNRWQDLNTGLPSHIRVAFFVRRLAEGLRAGDGSFADCRWSDVDAHCDGDENLRMVLEYILQAVHTFLSEALSMPEPSRRQRLRLLQEEIRSRGVALLKGADAPPWGQAVRTLIEVLTTATCKQSTVVPPGGSEPAAPSAEAVAASPGHPPPQWVTSPDKERSVPSDPASLSTPPGTPMAGGGCRAEEDLPLWRMAAAYLLALEASVNNANDIRRASRPPSTLTARLPPHCCETVREIGSKLTMMNRGGASDAARAAAGAALNVLLRRLLVQVEAADIRLETDEGARAELHAALERACTAIAQRVPPKTQMVTLSVEAPPASPFPAQRSATTSPLQIRIAAQTTARAERVPACASANPAALANRGSPILRGSRLGRCLPEAKAGPEVAAAKAQQRPVVSSDGSPVMVNEVLIARAPQRPVVDCGNSPKEDAAKTPQPLAVPCSVAEALGPGGGGEQWIYKARAHDTNLSP